MKKPISCLRFPKKDNQYIFGLEDNGYYSYGVIVNFDAKTAEVKDSCSLTRYINGSTVTHTQWDDEQPDWYDARLLKNGFENKLKKDIDRHLSWHIERLFRTYPIGANQDVYEILL